MLARPPLPDGPIHVNYARRVNFAAPASRSDTLKRAVTLLADHRAARFTVTTLEGNPVHHTASAAATVHAILARLYHGNALCVQSWSDHALQLDAVTIDPASVPYAVAAEHLTIPASNRDVR